MFYQNLNLCHMKVHKKKKTTHGFTFIECVVATALLSFLVLLVSSFSAQVYSLFLMSNRRMNAAIVNNIALDRFARDLFSASARPLAWDTSKGVFIKEMIDRKGKELLTCVEWHLCTEEKYRGALERYEGVYDFANHSWKKKTISIVEGFFSQFSIKVMMQNNRIFSVIIDCTDQCKRHNVVTIQLASVMISAQGWENNVPAQR